MQLPFFGGFLTPKDQQSNNPNPLPTDAAPATPDPEQQPAKSAAPPYRTNLKPIGGPQAISKYAMQRMTELRLEMGLSEQNKVQDLSWMWVRKRNEQSFQNDFSWRESMNSIFQKSNFTMGSGMRHTRYIAARVQDDILGTNPFFAVMGLNPGKEDLAKQLEQFVQDELDRSKVRTELREGQQIAIVRNEVVVKSSWEVNTSRYSGPADVFINTDGQPILTTQKGLMVYDGDSFVPSPSIQGAEVLEKDPSLIVTPAAPDGSRQIIGPAGKPQVAIKVMHFEDLPQIITIYEGVKATNLDFKAFLCPLKVESIAEADACFHLYMESPNTLRAKFGGIDVGAEYFTWWDAPGDKQAKYEQGENDFYPSLVNAQIMVAEGYIRYDFDGDGEDEEVLVVMDARSGKLIYFNYLFNHLKRRPFDVICGLEKIPNRWYGRGIYSLTELHQLYEDAQFNRINAKDAKAASATFAYRDAVTEWKNGDKPKFGTNDVYFIEGNAFDAKNRPPVFRVNLDENVEIGEKCLELMSQAEDAIVGAISNRDASQSDLNQSKTATGIVNLQASSDVITKATEQIQSDQIEGILELHADMIIERMDPLKLILDGKGALSQLNRDEARTLNRSVRMLMTRSRSTQMQQIAQQAIQIAKDFWALLSQNPRMAKALRPLYIDGLKGLEINEADEILPEVTDDMIAQFDAQQQQGQSPPLSPESVSISYKDMPDPIRRQAEARAGFQPLTPEQEQAEAAKDQQQAAVDAANNRTVKPASNGSSAN